MSELRDRLEALASRGTRRGADDVLERGAARRADDASGRGTGDSTTASCRSSTTSFPSSRSSRGSRRVAATARSIAAGGYRRARRCRRARGHRDVRQWWCGFARRRGAPTRRRGQPQGSARRGRRAGAVRSALDARHRQARDQPRGRPEDRRTRRASRSPASTSPSIISSSRPSRSPTATRRSSSRVARSPRARTGPRCRRCCRRRSRRGRRHAKAKSISRSSPATPTCRRSSWSCATTAAGTSAPPTPRWSTSARSTTIPRPTSAPRRRPTSAPARPKRPCSDALHAWQAGNWDRLIALAPPDELPLYDYRAMIDAGRGRQRTPTSRSTISRRRRRSTATPRSCKLDASGTTGRATATADLAGRWNVSVARRARSRRGESVEPVPQRRPLRNRAVRPDARRGIDG